MPATARCQCGTTWIQHGEQSGHCVACHHTFYGLESFDKHIRHPKDAPAVHLDPSEHPPSPTRKGWLADHEGQWHYCKPTHATTWAQQQELNRDTMTKLYGTK